MVFASRVVLLGLPMAVLAAVGLVYLIRRLARENREEPERPKKRELDKMKIENL